ncbi:ubiquitin-fold modifier 1 isoform X2 [Pygocentrus nattereri]|uniref:ubiquitin-fold modifier 1 isoform X2 n=1 Tax=Pygocentrus nattereri TaxID=42514 RepID=UPI001891290A|nr:ubiquitin-fold modifier 1 isoform X2 [Pygocentrus nattereri]
MGTAQLSEWMTCSSGSSSPLFLLGVNSERFGFSALKHVESNVQNHADIGPPVTVQSIKCARKYAVHSGAEVRSGRECLPLPAPLSQMMASESIQHRQQETYF